MPANTPLKDMLKDKNLLRAQCYIDGKWMGEGNNSITDPSTGSEIAKVPAFGKDETKQAVEAAHLAFPGWSSTLAKERASMLRKWFNLIMEYKNDLAIIMTREQGKPMKESRGEIEYAASFIEFFAEESKRLYGETIPTFRQGARVITIRQPIGVVATITPWNFPAAMITRKVAPALAAGCTVVIRPSDETPLTALALVELAERVGFPKGVINIVTGKASDIGKELSENKLVRALSFTGSTKVGGILMGQAAETIKKVGMELGGNAPFIVFDDADIDAAVEGAIQCKFRNGGQTCVCANRILVQEKVYDAFEKKFVDAAQKLKVANGFEEGADIGPLINSDAVKKVEANIKDAVEKGAKILLGGKRHEKGGNYFQTTVLSGMTMDMRAAGEEIFGPVAPLYTFSTEDEAIKMSNDTDMGLASYFYSRDVGRIFRVAEALEYGIVGINTGLISSEVVPFGGVKQSGIGREGSKHGMDEFTEIKYILMAGLESQS
jgi:succinate-semialdehyde dehydrogenase/glutarate-semialdehyde dehydrogenase